MLTRKASLSRNPDLSPLSPLLSLKRHSSLLHWRNSLWACLVIRSSLPSCLLRLKLLQS